MNPSASWCGTALRALVCTLAVSSLWNVLAAGAGSGASGPGVCNSQGGRFPKFSFEGQSPRKASKGPGDLTLCRVYHKKTCCTAVQTRAALLSLAKLASNGEANKQCLELWEVLECSICDPQVGVNPGPPLLCSSFCEGVYEACGDAFFSADPSTQVLIPCKDTVCARGREWASSSTEFCKLAGFSVPIAEEDLKSLPACYDGKVHHIDTEPLFEKRQSTAKGRYRFSYLRYLRKIFRRMTSGENVSWAVGGLVLTGGALYLFRRRGFKPRSRQELAARRSKIYQEAPTRQSRGSNSIAQRSWGKGTTKVPGS